jgi:hypothetical protein
MNRARRPSYWCADIPPERDVAIIMPASRNGKTFETPEQVTELNERRIAELWLSGSRRARQQAEAIESCEPPDLPCGLASCAVCCRQHRRAFTAEGLGLFEDADNVVRVTAFSSLNLTDLGGGLSCCMQHRPYREERFQQLILASDLNAPLVSQLRATPRSEQRRITLTPIPGQRDSRDASGE